ncbi:MAG: DUF2007 domain-containing protein [Salinimicrobium sp.]
MEYITIHTTTDKAEISSLKALFEGKGIHYRIVEEDRKAMAERDQPEQRLQVREEDREKARKLLHESGYLKIGHPYEENQRKAPMKRWMFLFLAALVLLIVILLVAWFMNPDLH